MIFGLNELQIIEVSLYHRLLLYSFCFVLFFSRFWFPIRLCADGAENLSAVLHHPGSHILPPFPRIPEAPAARWTEHSIPTFRVLCAGVCNYRSQGPLSSWGSCWTVKAPRAIDFKSSQKRRLDRYSIMIGFSSNHFSPFFVWFPSLLLFTPRCNNLLLVIKKIRLVITSECFIIIIIYYYI